jgi:hypothetical protein
MLIYVKNIKKKKKKLFTDRQTDGRTDRRTTQNYSSEPHKIDSAHFRKMLEKIFI